MNKPGMKKKAVGRNRTIFLDDEELERFARRLVFLDKGNSLKELSGKTICQDVFEALPLMPEASFDLLFADPPYNLSKKFNGKKFQEIPLEDYEEWLESWLAPASKLLKKTASVYICGDWRSSAAIQRAGSRYFKLRNRISWEREKGRGAKANWKNCSEDIWYFTVSDEFTFNLEEVRLKRKVIAPYRENGKPKDWQASEEGAFRLTSPSNIWTDISVPFWSMPENTEHPTQKPEKLMAKIILASSNPGDAVLDPFLGSGTTSVVAKKLNRNFVGIEIDRKFASTAEKRLEMADSDGSIQGYTDGVFWERNTLNLQNRKTNVAFSTTN